MWEQRIKGRRVRVLSEEGGIVKVRKGRDDSQIPSQSKSGIKLSEQVSPS